MFNRANNIANKHITANIVDVPPWTIRVRTSAVESERCIDGD